MAKRGGFPGGMPGNMNNLMKQAQRMPRQMFVKRAMDIAGGLVGCLFTGIAAIFLVPAIKIKSPGPAFFSQVRMGKNGRPFKIYKFRSMYNGCRRTQKRTDETK